MRGRPPGYHPYGSTLLLHRSGVFIGAPSMSTIEQTPAAVDTSAAQPRVSVVIPCLNEAENIEECVTRAVRVMAEASINGEVIVADNGSDDGSPELAKKPGAVVVHEPRRGYGSAYLAGFAAARGEYVVM